MAGQSKPFTGDYFKDWIGSQTGKDGQDTFSISLRVLDHLP